jgi:hypothetical protein
MPKLIAWCSGGPQFDYYPKRKSLMSVIVSFTSCRQMLLHASIAERPIGSGELTALATRTSESWLSRVTLLLTTSGEGAPAPTGCVVLCTSERRGWLDSHATPHYQWWRSPCSYWLCGSVHLGDEGPFGQSHATPHYLWARSPSSHWLWFCAPRKWPALGDKEDVPSNAFPTLLVYFFLFWKNKRRLMKSTCCLSVYVYRSAYPSLTVHLSVYPLNF